MKPCPSCNAQVEDSEPVCPTCGHAFAAGEEGNAPKKTQMGFPSVQGDPDGEGAETGTDEDGREPHGTLFGIPAQGEGADVADAEDEEAEDAAEGEDEVVATNIVPAEQLEALGLEPNPDADPRSTVAGFPSAGSDDDPTDEQDEDNDPAGQSVEQAWGLDEDSFEGGQATMVAPASAMDEALADSGEGTGYSRVVDQGEKERNFGTLLGMTAEEFDDANDEEEGQGEGGNPARVTQFSVPAAQADDLGDEATSPIDEEPAPEEPDTAVLRDTDESPTAPPDGEVGDEESGPAVDDAPTRAWNPSEDPDFKDAIEKQDRKRLLAKIRKSREKDDGEERSTAKGIPAAEKDAAGDDDSPDLASTQKDPEPVPGAVPERGQSPDRKDVATPVEFPDEAEAQPTSGPETETEDSGALAGGTPTSGVLRPSKKRGKEAEGDIDAEADTGVLGGGTYMVSRRDSSADDLSAAEDSAAPKPRSRSEAEEVVDDELATADTSVAPPDLVPKEAADDDVSPFDVTDPARSIPDREEREGPSTQFEISGSDAEQAPGEAAREGAQPPEATNPEQPLPPDRPSLEATNPEQPVPPDLPVQQPDGPPTPGPQQGTGTPAPSGDSQPPTNLPQQFRDPPEQPPAQTGEPFGGAPRPPAGQQQRNVGTPAAPHAPAADAGIDLVWWIQTGFAVLGGLAIMGGAGFVVLDSGMPEGLVAVVTLVFAALLGLIGGLMAVLPLDQKLRSLAFGGIGVVTLVTMAAGFFVGLPQTVIALVIGVLLCFIAAAFPVVSRMLS